MNPSTFFTGGWIMMALALTANCADEIPSHRVKRGLGIKKAMKKLFKDSPTSTSTTTPRPAIINVVIASGQPISSSTVTVANNTAVTIPTLQKKTKKGSSSSSSSSEESSSKDKKVVKKDKKLAKMKTKKAKYEGEKKTLKEQIDSIVNVGIESGRRIQTLQKDLNELNKKKGDIEKLITQAYADELQDKGKSEDKIKQRKERLDKLDKKLAKLEKKIAKLN